MVGGVPQPSRWCARGDHDACPHWVALTARGSWRLRPQLQLIVCNDPCHSRRHCPVADQTTASQDAWSARCTCPGAEASRRSFERSAENRRRRAAVFADVDLTDQPNAATIERRLADAFLAHGEQPPRGLAGMSEVMAARRPRRCQRPTDPPRPAHGRRGAHRRHGPAHGRRRPDIRVAAAAVGSAALLFGLFTTRMITVGIVVGTVVRAVKGAQHR